MTEPSKGSVERASEWAKLFSISRWKPEIQAEIWNTEEKVVLAVFFGATWKSTEIKGVRREVLAHRARVSLRTFTRVMYVLDNLARVVTRSGSKTKAARRKGAPRGEVATYTLHPEKLQEWAQKPRPKEWDALLEEDRPREIPTSREHADAVEEARRAAGAAEDDPIWADLVRRAEMADVITNREAAAEQARERAREKHLARKAKLLEGLEADLAEARTRTEQMVEARQAAERDEAQQAAQRDEAQQAAERARAEGAQSDSTGQSARGERPESAAGTHATGGTELALAGIIARAPPEHRVLLETVARGAQAGHEFCVGVAARVLRKARAGAESLLTAPEREVIKGLPDEWAAKGGPGPRKVRTSLQLPAEPGEYDWSEQEEALDNTF